MHAGGVLIQLVGVRARTIAAVAREATRARVTGNKLAEQHLVVGGFKANDGAACRQGARRATGTANARCATETGVISQDFRAFSVVDFVAGGAVGTCRRGGATRRVKLRGRVRAECRHACVDLAVEVGVPGVCVGHAGAGHARAATAACDSNHGAVDEQCGGAATGCGVDLALGVCRVSVLCVDLRSDVGGDGVGGYGAAVTVAFTAGGGVQGAVADTACRGDDLHGGAGGYGDDAGDLRAGARLGHAVVGTTRAADQLKTKLVDVVGHGEALHGLGAFVGAGDAVCRVGRQDAVVGGGDGCRVGGDGCRGCDDRCRPGCASDELAAGQGSRHGMPFIQVG